MEIILFWMVVGAAYHESADNNATHPSWGLAMAELVNKMMAWVVLVVVGSC